jgi:hypothetical protein
MFGDGSVYLNGRELVEMHSDVFCIVWKSHVLQNMSRKVSNNAPDGLQFASSLQLTSNSVYNKGVCLCVSLRFKLISLGGGAPKVMTKNYY